jgi:hypothetical protein
MIWLVWLSVIRDIVVIIGTLVGVYRVCQIEKNTRKPER